MKGLVFALGFLTRLPVPRLAATRDEFPAAIRWYPVVGSVVGAAVVPAARWPLILVPFAARRGPLLWARMLPPLGEGLGATVAGAVRARDLATGAAMLAAAAVAAPALLAAVPLIAGRAYWLRWRLGGVNGDAHGAGIELVEVGLLLALAAVGQR